MKPAYFFIFFFGTLWGSFFYTLALRYINGSFEKDVIKSLFSSSKCPACNMRIKSVHLIPVAGYLILRGKCANCREVISPLYPIFEIVYGLLLVLISAVYGNTTYSFSVFVIISLSISISIIDIKILTIPDSLVALIVIVSVYPVILNGSFADNLYGFLLMGVFFVLILLIFPGSFGGGDVKFASAIGFVLGLELSVVALETALISGSIIGIIYAVKTGKTLRIKMPFAPFLSAGLLVSLLYGRDIVLLYNRMFF